MITSIVEETVINFTPDGILLVNIDAGRTCMVSLKLERELFDTYKCEKPMDMGLNLMDFTKILKRCSKDDTISLKYLEGDNKIVIVMEKPNSKKIRSFSLTMRDISTPNIKPEALANIPFDNHIHIPMAYLSEIVKDAEVYSDAVSVTIDKDGLITVSESSVGEIETVIGYDDPNIRSIKNSENANGAFALKYMRSIEKMGSIPTVDSVELYLKSENPLKAVSRLGEGSYIEVYIAPRIDEENGY
jgi:proliferating cell nuclear antigen